MRKLSTLGLDSSIQSTLVIANTLGTSFSVRNSGVWGSTEVAAWGLRFQLFISNVTAQAYQ